MNSQHRERLILRYLSALETGDVENMQRVLEEAEHDHLLTGMIVQAHEAYELEAEGVSMAKVKLNGHSNQASHHFVSMPITEKPSTKTHRTRSYWVAGIAAALTFVLLSVIVNNRQVSNSGLSDEQGIPFDVLQPITADNVDRLTHLASLGTGAAYDADWSPDGQWLAVSSATGVYLHDAEDMTVPATLLGGRSMRVTRSAFNPDGTLLAGIHRNSIILWNVSTGEVFNRIDAEDQMLDAVQFSADGTQLAAAGCQTYDAAQTCQQSTLHIWDTQTGEEIHTLVIESTRNLTLTPDFTYAAYVVYNPTAVHLVEVASGETMAVIEQPFAESSSAFAFNADGSKFVIGGMTPSESLRIFDVSELVSGDSDNSSIPQIIGQGPELRFIAFLPGEEQVLTIRNEGNVGLRNAVTGMREHAFGIEVGLINTAAVNVSADRFAVIDWSGLVRVYSLETGDLQNQLLQYGTGYEALAFALDDSLVIAGGLDWRNIPVRIWNIADSAFNEQWNLAAIENGNLFGTQNLAVSPDGRELAYIDNNTDLHVFNLQTGEDRLLRHFGSDGSVEYAEDGTLIVMTRDLLLRFNDFESEPESQRLLGLLTTRYGRVIRAISPDAEFILSGNFECDSDQGVLLCTASTLDLWTPELEHQMLQLEDGASAEFPTEISTDNQLLARSICSEVVVEPYGDAGHAVRCRGGEVLVWNVGEPHRGNNSGEMEPTPVLASLGGYVSVPSAMAFAPTNTATSSLLVTNSLDDEYLHFWHINTSDGAFETLEAMGNPETTVYATSITFNDSGTLLAFSSEGIVQLWGVIE